MSNTSNNNSAEDTKHSKDWQKVSGSNHGGDKDAQSKVGTEREQKVGTEKDPQPKM